MRMPICSGPVRNTTFTPWLVRCMGKLVHVLQSFGRRLSLWWSCVALRGLWDLFVFGSCLCVSWSSWLSCAPRCACVGPSGPVVFALFCFWLLSLSVLLSLPPRVVWFGALVQRGTWFAGTSLWVSGCSCDGLVALLSCWECG